MSDRLPFDPWRVHPPPGPLGRGTPLTVREVNELIRGALARHMPAVLVVLGEIGDLTRATSGHLYFTLKDRDAELRCVMWKSQAGRLRFRPESGQEVLVTGVVEHYAPRGLVQLVVRTLEPRGVGALELAFRQLRERLEREGLFAAERKRPLPRYPRRIALVTSLTGAAVRDVLQTLARRYPVAEVLIAPVRVQGEGAAGEIAAAITGLSAAATELGGIDVLIVARGGGSLEDLWAFNEEPVARAIATCCIPVVSGVGHEIDVTIADLAADLRAPTPTAAAELCTPNLPELRAWLVKLSGRLTELFEQQVALKRARLDRLLAAEVLARPERRLCECAQAVDEALQLLRLALHELFRGARERMHRGEAALLRLGGGAWAQRARRRLEDGCQAGWRALVQNLGQERSRLGRLMVRLVAASPDALVQRSDERLTQGRRRLFYTQQQLLERQRRRLEARLAELAACDPRCVLKRGYSLVRDARTRSFIRSVRQVRDGQPLRIETSDGEYRATAEDPRQARLFDELA